jgi:hypothetical protein
LIAAPGECIEAEKLTDVPEGYKYELVPSNQAAGGLTDTYDQDELSAWLGFRVAIADKPRVRALRASWADLLERSIADDEFVIFGESDAVPRLSADTVKTIIATVFDKHKDVDVIRLFNDHSCNPYKEGDSLQTKEWKGSKDKASFAAGMFGTHALIIRRKARERLAKYLRMVRLPADTLLEWMTGQGLLKVDTFSSNIFYQAPRTSSADVTTLYSYRYRKLALMMASYKRPSDLLRQIYAMMDQAYPKDMFHLYVSIKGIDTASMYSLISPVLHFVKEGRLTINRAENSDQFTNLMDTIKGIPEDELKSYDKFLKIDDDDFYSREYLARVNGFYTYVNDDVSTNCRNMTTGLLKTAGLNNPIVHSVPSTYYGGTLVFTYDCLKEFDKCRTDKAVLQKYTSMIPVSKDRPGFTEDGVLDTIMIAKGYVPMSSVIGSARWCVILNQSNASITRGGLVPKELYNEVMLTHPDTYSREDIYALSTSDDGIVFVYAFNEKCHIVYGKIFARGTISKVDGNLQITWDGMDAAYTYRYNAKTFLYEQQTPGSIVSDANCS